MMNFKTLSLIPICAVSLSACLSILPGTSSAPSIYRLSHGQMISEKQADAAVLLIRRIVAPNGLSGEDIVLSPDGERIAYAANARWEEPVPGLVQHAAKDAFASISSISPISAPTTLRSDYTLQLNLRQFEAEFDNGEKNAPLARVMFTATLVDTQKREMIATRQFSASQRASEASVSNIVRAQRSATKGAMADMAGWADQEISRQPKF